MTTSSGAGGQGGGGMTPTVETSGGSLLGSWHVKNGSCGLSLLLHANQTFGVAEACELDDGTIGLDVKEGTYSVSGNTLRQSFQTFSCDSRRPGALSVQFRVTASNLTLIFVDGESITFRKGKLPLNGTSSAQGCLTEDSFTPAN